MFVEKMPVTNTHLTCKRTKLVEKKKLFEGSNAKDIEVQTGQITKNLMIVQTSIRSYRVDIFFLQNQYVNMYIY